MECAGRTGGQVRPVEPSGWYSPCLAISELARRFRDFEAPERDTAMPNPKRRHSKRRTALRRSHDFLTPTGLSICTNCQERKLPHRACRKCGEYKGRAVLAVKEAS
jgi:large subunit ribosomal protein L32